MPEQGELEQQAANAQEWLDDYEKDNDGPPILQLQCIQLDATNQEQKKMKTLLAKLKRQQSDEEDANDDIPELQTADLDAEDGMDEAASNEEPITYIDVQDNAASSDFTTPALVSHDACAASSLEGEDDDSSQTPLLVEDDNRFENENADPDMLANPADVHYGDPALITEQECDERAVNGLVYTATPNCTAKRGSKADPHPVYPSSLSVPVEAAGLKLLGVEYNPRNLLFNFGLCWLQVPYSLARSIVQFD
jgi:hypothetical protein